MKVKYCNSSCVSFWLLAIVSPQGSLVSASSLCVEIPDITMNSVQILQIAQLARTLLLHLFRSAAQISQQQARRCCSSELWLIAHIPFRVLS
jgi:hypothetical protein